MKSLLVTIVISLFALPTAASGAEPASMELAVKKVQAYDGGGIRIDAVSVESGMLNIRGRADENSDISRLMRYLDKNVGSPTLEYVKRSGSTSDFLLKVKKLR